MSKKLIEEVQLKLTEEKWTRATLNDYVIGNFKEFDQIIDEVKSAKLFNEIKQLCEEHLINTKNSIIALYISGVIALNKQTIDDSHLMDLIAIFTDHHKWKIVEYLCQRILQFGENKDALRKLSEAMKNLDDKKNMYDIWQRLLKVDYSEAEIAKRLAEVRENEGNADDAILYYRKAIHRYVNKKMFSNVRDIWNKLVTHGVDDYEFFFLIEKKVAKSMNSDRAVTLLEALYPATKEREEWGTAINILKRILNYDPKNNWARQQIIQCYRSNYTGHSHLEECLNLSNLNQNWRNVAEAIADFEKHISFDEGNFVHHKTWGVGIIKKIHGDEIIVDFSRKRTHSMSLKMAVGALQSLTREHIWVLKSIHPKDKLKTKIKSDIPWALKIIIRSFDNLSDMKKIKAELVPAIFSQSEWSVWSPEARRILKTDPAFGNLPDRLDQFLVRDRPMSFDEKTFNQFKAEKKFFSKIQYLMDFLDNSDPDSDFFAEMLNYFVSLLNIGTVNFQVVSSYLLLNRITAVYPFLDTGPDCDFSDLWADIEDPVGIFSDINNEELRIDFLNSIKSNVDDWQKVYLDILPVHPSETIIGQLYDAGFKDDVVRKLGNIIEHFRERRDSFMWLAQNINISDALLHFPVDMEKITINIIRLLALTYNDIENKRDVVENRKINRQANNFLFKEGKLKEVLGNSGKSSAIRIFTLLNDITFIAPSLKKEYRSLLKKLHPGIFLSGERKTKTPVSTPANANYFYSTQTMITKKHNELKNLVEVEIPKNSKEIGNAIELGDLSENAEYKAAKERQESLQIKAGKLKESLDRVRAFPKDEVSDGKVGFGTKITIEDMIDGGEQSYTILGPWESNPSEKTISYLSPFGNAFLGSKIGNLLEFDINDRHYKFTIRGINPVL